jgi:hypothetical protein
MRWQIRPGQPAREVFGLDGEVFVFRSDHPLEERIVVLTDDYRDERGDYLVPEAVAWDGVVTGWLER